MRLVIGACFEGIGLLLVTLSFTGWLTGEWPFYAGLALVIVGLFGIFEGLAGWCVVRAMGFKTRL